MESSVWLATDFYFGKEGELASAIRNSAACFHSAYTDFAENEFGARRQFSLNA